MQAGCNLCNQVIAAARAFLLYDADWNGAPRESWVVVHHKLGVGGLETRARHSRLQEPTPFLRSPGTLTRDEFQDLMDNHSMVSGSVHKKGAGVGSERDPRSQQPVRPPATPEAHRLLGLPSGPERSALVTGMRLRWRSGTGVKSPISRR